MHPRLGVQVHLDENNMAARLEKKTIERAAWLQSRLNGPKLLEGEA
jgi:hypothetical protein